jgi:hypothetical protein
MISFMLTVDVQVAVAVSVSESTRIICAVFFDSEDVSLKCVNLRL